MQARNHGAQGEPMTQGAFGREHGQAGHPRRRFHPQAALATAPSFRGFSICPPEGDKISIWQRIGHTVPGSLGLLMAVNEKHDGLWDGQGITTAFATNGNQSHEASFSDGNCLGGVWDRQLFRWHLSVKWRTLCSG
jgi:hypothetical protein